MPAHTKPGIDWPALRNAYERGTPVATLAEANACTVQAIYKRRTREGWKNPTGGSGVRMMAHGQREWLPRVQALNVITPGPAQSAEAASRVAAAIARGLPDNIAAALAGIAPSTLSEWINEDEGMRQLVHEAHAEWHADRVGDLNDASERGDPQAAKWMLERHSRSREHWRGADSTGGLTISVAFGFMAQPTQQVVDHASVITVDAVEDGAELQIEGPKADK